MGEGVRGRVIKGRNGSESWMSRGGKVEEKEVVEGRS